MATAPASVFDEVYGSLYPDETRPKAKKTPGARQAAPTPPVTTSPSPAAAFDEVYQQLYPNESHTVPGATVQEIQTRPRSAGAPELAPVGVGAAPPPVVRPGTPPAPQSAIRNPQSAMPNDYSGLRAGITATAADLAAQKPELDREEQALARRFQGLKTTEQEIKKGLEIKRTRPAEWNPNRDLALQVKVDRYEAERQQFTADQEPFLTRQKAFHEAVTRAQAEEARLKYAPATAIIPKIPTFAPPPFPEEPLFLGAEDATRRTPPGVSAPGRYAGAMQHQALAAGRYHMAAEKQIAQYEALAPQLKAAAEQLTPLQAQLVAGKLSPADEKRVVQAGVKLQAQLKAYSAGLKRLQVQDARAVKFLADRLAAGYLPHAGGEYPEELAERLGKPQGWLEQHVNELGNLIKESYRPLTTVAQKKAMVILGGLMVTGESPPLPPNPGQTPEDRKKYRDIKNQVRQYIDDEQAAIALAGEIAKAPARYRRGLPQPDFDTLNARAQALGRDPWARQLLPILRAQSKAKQKADALAGVPGAAEKDARTLLVSTVWAELVGAGAALGLRNIPGVARILAEPIFGGGAKAFLTRAGTRLATSALSTGAATGTFSSVEAGGTAAAQGKGLKGSVKEGARAFPRGFAFGAALATGEELLRLGAAGAGLGYRRFVKYAHEPVPPGTQSGLLTLPEEYNPGPEPTTLAAGRVQIRFLEEARTQAEAELAAVVAAGEDAAAARAAAPRAVKSLLGPTTTPETLTAAEIRNAALQFVDGLNSRIIQTRGLLPGLAEVPLASAPDAPQLLTREEADQLSADRAAAAQRAQTPPPEPGAPLSQGPRPVLLEEPPALPLTRAEAQAAARAGRPPSPGGYEQAPPGLDAGPAVTAPGGTAVPFRYQTPAILAGLVNQLQQDGTPQSLAAIPVVQGYILRAQEYEQGRQVPPAAIETVQRAFSDPKEPARIAFQAISRAASATRDPDLAARLSGAAQAIQQDFGALIAATLPDAHDRDTGVDLAPPFVSPYRTLSGAQRSALDPDVRRALLVQDIANSTQVLHPGTTPFFTLPGSTGQLAGQADNLFRLAQRQALQSEVARSIPQPGAQVAVEAGQPQPSTIPGAQVAPEGPFQQRFGRPERFTRTQPSPVAAEQRGRLSAPAPRLSRRHQAIVKAIAPEGGASRVSLQRRFRLNRAEAGGLLSELQGEGILGQPGGNGQAPLLLSPDQLRALTPARATIPLSVAPRGPERAETLLAQAARLVADSGRASAPGLARRLRVTPEEAEALLAELQRLGVVSAPDRAGRRRVLMNHAQAEDAVSHAETLSRRQTGGYVPVPTPAPKVTITHHAPKKRDQGSGIRGQGKSKAEPSPPSPPTGKSAIRNPQSAIIRLRSKGGTEIEFKDGKGTLVKVAPGLTAEVGDTYTGTPEKLKAKGWTEVEPEGESAPKPVAEKAPAEKSAEKAAPAKTSEPREERAPAAPTPTPTPEPLLQESAVLALEERLAALPEDASFGDFLAALPEEVRPPEPGVEAPEEEGLPANVIAGQPKKGRLPSPSTREAPEKLTAAKIASVQRYGLDKVEAGQLVGVKDLKTQFTLTAPDPAKGPYAWTAKVTYRGLSPVMVGDPIFVNFANRPSNYVVDPGAPPPPPAAEKLKPEEKVAPKWAKVGVRFQAAGTQHIYQLLSRDAEAGTWMAQIVELAPPAVKEIENVARAKAEGKPYNPSFVPGAQVGRLDVFTDKVLHLSEPLGPAPEPVITSSEEPRELTPVPVTEERNDDLPVEPPPQTQVKERGAKPKAAKAKTVAEPAPVTIPAEQLGKTTVFTARNKDYEGQWAVVEMADLITSHDDSLVENPAYPQQYQPRERDELASQAQVIDIMTNLDPKRLGTNVLAGHGAPIVSPSLLVEAGNGRTIALRRLYRANPHRIPNYRGFLRSNAAEFGLTSTAIAKLKEPVLVRIRTQQLSEAERLDFVHAANAKEQLQPTAKATAKFVAARLTSRLMEHFNPDADLDLNAEQNRPWVKGLLSIFGPNDLGDMIEEKDTAFGKVTQLTDKGQRLAMDAVFYYAYGDEGLLGTITAAAADNPVKRVTGAMLRASGIWSVWRDRIKNGHAYDLDVTPDLLAAVHRLHVERKRTLDKRKVAAPMFADAPLLPVAQLIYDGLQKHKNSEPKIATFLSDIADHGMQVGDPYADNNEPALFDAGEKELPTTREIVEAALRRQGRNADRQTGVLPETEAGPGPTEGGNGPEARATTTGPVGGGDREPEAVGKSHFLQEWETLFPDVGPHLHHEGEFFINHRRWFNADLTTVVPGTPLRSHPARVIWPAAYPLSGPEASWMAEDGFQLPSIFRRLAYKLLTQEELARMGAVGFLVDTRTLGMNLRWGDRTDVFVNPFLVPGGTSNVYRTYGSTGETPFQVANQIALVMLHEIAHFRVREEGGKLWDEMDELFENIGSNAYHRVVEAIKLALTGGSGNEFSQKYQKARAAYAEAVGDGRRGGDAREPGGDAGTGPESPSRVTRGVSVGEGGAGRNRGRGPTARATSVTPGGQYPDPRQEAQYEEARVPNPRPDEGDWDRFTRHLRELVQALTREFPQLQSGGKYAQLMSLLHGAMKANQMGKEEAKRWIDQIYRPLLPDEKELFDRALNIFDMREDQTILLGRLREMNKSLSEAEAKAEVDRTIQYPVWVNPETGKEEVIWTAEGVRDLAAQYEQYVNASPRVARAIAARRKMVKEVGDKLIYWVERATGRKIELPREDYIHRMVLEYVMGPDALRKVGGPSRRGGMRTVSRGFLMARHGTTLAHNTHYVARETEWLSQALADIPLYQLWAYIGEAFDVAGDATAIAKAANFERLMERLEEKAEKLEMVRVGKGEGQPITAESIYRGWSREIAGAFSYYGYLAATDQLTRHPDGRFDALFQQLADAWSYERALSDLAIEEEIPYHPRPVPEKLEHGIHEYGAWILQESRRAGEGLPGSAPAGKMFQAVAERRKRIEEVLGHQIEDVDDVLKGDPRFKDHVWVQPSPGRKIFTKLMIQDRIGQELNEAIIQEAKITADDLTRMPVLGGPKLRLLVPKVIAATLDGLDEYQSKSALSHVAREVTRPIKMTQLYNPIHTIDFWIRKGVTDVQSMILGGRGWALKEELVPAFKMVAGYVLTGKMPELTPDAHVTLPSGSEATVTFNDADRRAEFWEFLKFGALHQSAAMADVERERQFEGSSPAALPAVSEKEANSRIEQLAELWTTGMIKTKKGRKIAQDIFQVWGPQAITILDGAMRFAVYMSSFKEMAESDTNRVKNVGFAHWQEVAAIEGVGRTADEQRLDQRRRRAWLIADEMMVAYGKTPPALVWLANHGVYPWVRFYSQNLRRTMRLVANPAWEQGLAQKVWLKGVDDAAREWAKEIEASGGSAPPRLPRKRGGTGGGGGGRGGGGKGRGPEEPPDIPWHGGIPRSPRVLVNQASLIMAIYYIARGWQYAVHWLHHDLERDLPEKVREEAHAIIGLDPFDHDQIMAFVRLSAADDILAISDPLGAIEKVHSGKWTPAQAVMEVVLHNPARELLQLQGQGQALLDVLKGQGSYPDPLNPRPKEADLAAWLDVVGYGGVLRWAANVHHKSASDRLFSLVGIHEFGRLESNYFETRELAQGYMHKPRENPGKNERSAALYNFFQAARHGDKEGYDYYLLSYIVLGGKPAGLREAVKGHDPFLTMNDDQAAAFVYQMDPDERARAQGAYMHYKHEVDAVTGQTEPLAKEILKIGNDMERILAIRQEIRLELLVNNPIGDVRDRHPEMDQKIEAADEAARKALHPELPVGAK